MADGDAPAGARHAMMPCGPSAVRGDSCEQIICWSACEWWSPGLPKDLGAQDVLKVWPAEKDPLGSLPLRSMGRECVSPLVPNPTRVDDKIDTRPVGGIHRTAFPLQHARRPQQAGHSVHRSRIQI